ncbi:hypothetical protein CLIB1423_19S00694 [[Candida] railenensis]|uniref:Something about silencing protein 4 domain-containing protein n=1 Tax=[Candida] railenensis TaxID=45579 RepID=A0A9P0QTR9_9ASCO|nr:hypothetical protein CLIB1423_19S00694 [[Candida] railenensis]
MPNERKLRSKDEIRRSNPTLFNFEKINKLLFRDQPIKVTSSLNFENLYNESGASSSSQQPKVPTSKANSVVIREELLPRKSKGKARDVPLQDSNYELFHKRMKKEEKKMTNIDRQRILNECDTLETSLRLLEQHDWVKHIRSITQIYDPHNYKELEYKKVLTIYEIKRLLKKYASWKKREDQLMLDIKQYNHKISHRGENTFNAGDVVSNGHSIHNDLEPNSDSVESEFSLSLDELKNKRKSERCQKYGQIIKLKLHNGLSLVIDPVFPPKFIQTLDTSTKTTPVTSNSPEPKDTSTEEVAKLGIEIPNIEPHNFTISQNWKLHSKEWKSERAKLRNSLHAKHN